MEKVISEKNFKCYTMLKKIIYDLELENKEYWWLISDIYACPHKQEYYDLIYKDNYALIKTSDLLKMLEDDDFQWVWAVFSVIPVKYTEDEILSYDLPKLQDIEKGEYNPYTDAPRLQHPLAEFELYAVDSSYMFLISNDEKLLSKFKKMYPKQVKSNNDNIIEIKNLHKSFGDIHAVDGLSISVKKGQLYAFLGLNGAGKSTTISIMCGHQSKDSGKIFIDGFDLDKNLDQVKSEIGVVFQFSALDKVLSVKDNLESRASLYGLTKEKFKERLDELDSLLNIKCLLKRTFGKLSGGEKRRVDFARALLNKPKILILDEPTTGLDPQTRKTVWNVINKLRQDKQITVFLTTHYMEETTDADYVVILDKGKIVGEGTPIELKDKFTGDFIILYDTKEQDVAKLNLPYQKVVGGYKISIESTSKATELIQKYPKLFVNYEIIKGNMDDVFLAVTGKNLKEANV